MKTIVEAVISNSGGELDRIELERMPGSDYWRLPGADRIYLSPGDTIKIEERETED